MGYKIVFNHPDDAYRILDIAEACVKELGRISQEVLCASLCLDVLHDDVSIGWDDLYKARILHEKEGYVLHLPDPKHIKKLSHDGFEWQHWFQIIDLKTIFKRRNETCLNSIFRRSAIGPQKHFVQIPALS